MTYPHPTDNLKQHQLTKSDRFNEFNFSPL